MKPQSLNIQADFQRDTFHFQVDIDLPMQGVTAIFGRSGCGKTTLLRVIAGLEKIPLARVRFGEAQWQDGRHFVPLHQRRIGLVFQEHSLFPHLTVRGNLLYGFNRTPVDQRRLTLQPVAELLGLTELLDRRIDALSGGQRQRVAIGRALLTSPQLLLLDEPLSALDAITKREIMPFLEHLSQQVGVPIIMISHSAKEVERLADRVIFMVDGKVDRIETLQQALYRADSPLFADEGASSVLMAKVEILQAGDGLSCLRPSGSQCQLWLPEVAHVGNYRVRIMARDVGISLSEPQDSSLLNVLKVTIEHIEPSAQSALLTLRLGEQTLFAQISLRSLRQLRLSVCMQVYALIKAMALV